MTKMLQALYQHARENCAPAFLVGGEYEDLGRALDRQEKEITALLLSDNVQVWNDFQRDCELLRSLELEAMFQAGLSVGLELSRV